MRRDEDGAESRGGVPVGDDGLEDGKDEPGKKGEDDSGISGPEDEGALGKDSNDAARGELDEVEE